MAVTTIKVDTALRDRLNQIARGDGVSVSTALEGLVADRERAAATTLAIVLPVTSRDRGWRNHIALTGRTGLPGDSWAMTEQPRTISRERITRVVSMADAACLAAIRPTRAAPG